MSIDRHVARSIATCKYPSIGMIDHLVWSTMCIDGHCHQHTFPHFHTHNVLCWTQQCTYERIHIGDSSNEHGSNECYDECVTSDNGCMVYRDHMISAAPMKVGRAYRSTLHMISTGDYTWHIDITIILVCIRVVHNNTMYLGMYNTGYCMPGICCPCDISFSLDSRRKSMAIPRGNKCHKRWQERENDKTTCPPPATTNTSWTDCRPRAADRPP